MNEVAEAAHQIAVECCDLRQIDHPYLAVASRPIKWAEAKFLCFTPSFTENGFAAPSAMRRQVSMTTAAATPRRSARG
jgi:hypothetical protein